MPGRLTALLLLAAVTAFPVRAEEATSPWADPNSPWMPEKTPLALNVIELPPTFASPYPLLSWDQAFQLYQMMFTLQLHGLDVGVNWAIDTGLLLKVAGFLPPNSEYPSDVTLLYTRLVISMYSGIVLGIGLAVGWGWLQDEGHASVLASNGLENLALVHDRRAADSARYAEAGLESELEMVTRLERGFFFSNRPQESFWFYNAILLAIATGDAGLSDSSTDWAWDLSRPGVRYALRPSERITPDDLDLGEQRFLWQVRGLTFLNLLDGFLLAIWKRGYTVPSPLGGDLLANAALRHHLTASGDLFSLSILARQGPLKAEAAVQLHRSESLLLPGLSLSLYRYPLRLAGAPVFASVTAAGWLQPWNQSFHATAPSPGGSLSVTGATPLTDSLEGFLRVRAKTPGWVAGDPDLNASVRVSLGVNLMLWYPRAGPSYPHP